MNKYAQMADRMHDLDEQLERLEKENAELKDKLNNLSSVAEVRLANWQKYSKKLAEAKETIHEEGFQDGAIFGYNKAKEEMQKQIEKMKCCENCKHSDTECEGYTICGIGHYDDCLSNKVLYHTTDEKDYWEKSND